MVALDKAAFKDWIDRIDVVSVEQIAAWSAELLYSMALNSTFIPYLEGPRSNRFSNSGSFDGSDEYTTFISMALPTTTDVLGSAQPNWKGIKNSVSGTVPIRWYDTTIV